jgi:prepilin-type N-terminal cleavage/methylation domain-containing protein
LISRRRRTGTIFTPTADEVGRIGSHSPRLKGRARPLGALALIRGGPSGPALPANPVIATNRPVVAAFTLIELLAVVAVIGILAALLFPGLTAARVAANKARTRVQFNEWASALEGFRREYGYYPVLHASGLVNPPGQATEPGLPHLFHDVLAARRRDGSDLPAYSGSTDSLSAEAQNRKLVSFHTFGPAEIYGTASAAPHLLHDAFDHTEIAVLVDRNLDGVIQVGVDFTMMPVVGGIQPGLADFPAAGIRAGVIFYAPAADATAQSPGFVFSWK